MSDREINEIQTSVGTYLRRLREEKNLSIEDVSARLYLQSHVIEALEQDDHDSLPTGTYVYGYLQNYAKLLDTSADLVVSMYKEDITEIPEHIPERQPKPKTEQSGKWPYTILYLVIFVALLLPFTWWRSQYTESAVPPGPHMDQLRGGDKSHSELDYVYTIVEHPETHSYREPNTEQKQSVQASATPTENTTTSGIGPDSIRLVLTEDCWIEIFDANNEKVFYDLARGDQILVLNGTAPFSVLLGNAAAATVGFNTVPFDTAPHMSRIGMARFVLGEEQTER